MESGYPSKRNGLQSFNRLIVFPNKKAPLIIKGAFFVMAIKNSYC